MLSDAHILRHIERQPKKTASHKQLLRELGVKGEARRELTDRLYALVKKGQLAQIEDGRYAIPQAKAGRNTFVGRLSMHRDGFGFVIPEASSLDATLKSRLAGDVFIPPHATGTSMHGDRVLVEISAFRTDGRAEGRILRSVSRAHPTVVGTFHYGKAKVGSRAQQNTASLASRLRAIQTGRISTAWSLMSKSPTGQALRRIRTDASSKFWGKKTISAWTSKS